MRLDSFSSGAREGDTYVDFNVTTDGFVLYVPRARIRRSRDVVAIVPLPSE
ncbi:MAG: hypothetical protein JSW03_08410 [Candidatus Eiseniibacteriota bacterium]|nr:MAG: hypothetical protein JSW03_08410 [Candidatus Eisenbacteria bacterium]